MQKLLTFIFFFVVGGLTLSAFILFIGFSVQWWVQTSGTFTVFCLPFCLIAGLATLVHDENK